jgi:ferric-dicitrate binding protein FerR (iron transport regulator)
MHHLGQRIRLLPLVAIGLAAAALCAPSLKASQSPGWSVAVAANAFVTHGQQDAATPITMGASVEAGDHLTTGAGGSLVLTRGEDLVTLAENSAIEIVDPQPVTTTLIAQPYGQVQYHVTKEKVPHFQVDAPLLATVVKGTTFTVDASRSKSSVTVTEGRVVARNRRTGSESSVGAGERGAVDSRARGVEVGAAPVGSKAAAPAGSDTSNNVSGGGDGSSNSNSGNGNGNGNSGGGNGKGNNGNGNGNGGGNGSNGGGGGKGNGGGNGNGKNK